MLDGSRKQFQLGLIYLFASMATFGVLPFCILRLIQGEYIKAFIDLVIVIAAGANAIYAWRTREVYFPSIFAAVLYSMATIAVIYLNNPLYVFWLFPALSANFFLLGPRLAVVVNLLLLAAIIPVALQVEERLASLGMIISALFTGGMTYVFAKLANEQQAMLETFATHDALTQLGNRRLMDEEINRCIQDFKRSGIPASIIVIDLDFFKTVNDEYGHVVGDELLIKLAQLLTTRARSTDRVFRFGGEEFVVLARNTPLAAAQVIAEDLRCHIEQNIISPAGPVTASLGCAQLADEEDAAQWFTRADQAMYSAKQQGRNQVVMAHTMP